MKSDLLKLNQVYLKFRLTFARQNATLKIKLCPQHPKGIFNECRKHPFRSFCFSFSCVNFNLCSMQTTVIVAYLHFSIAWLCSFLFALAFRA
jgi:hypothetical protein